MSKAAKQYLREVDKQIICPSSAKKAFLRQLENEVYFYSKDSEVSLAMLYAQFGFPEEVAREFLSEMGVRTTDRYNRIQKKLKYLIVGALAAAILFTAMIGVRTNLLRQQLPSTEVVASISYETEKDFFSWLPLRGLIFVSKNH